MKESFERKQTMKEMMKMLLVAVCGATAAWGHAALPAVRVETCGTAGYYYNATGVECVGTTEGDTPIVVRHASRNSNIS